MEDEMKTPVDSGVKYVRADIHKAQSDELDSLRIALKESESGELRNALAVGQAVIELQEERKELDRLRTANARLQAECDRKQEWIDAVMGQPSFTNKYTYIRRPQPLAKE